VISVNLGATGQWRIPQIIALFSVLLATTPATAETINFGFGTDKPPYVFEHEARGLEYDIIQAAMREAGLTLNVRYLPIDRLHLTLEHGELDAIASTNVQSGLRNAAYSDVVLHYRNVAIALASKGYAIEDVEDLAPFSVSTFQSARRVLGSGFDRMAERNQGYREEPRQITRNRLLYTDRVDVIVGDYLIHQYLNLAAKGEVDVDQPIAVYPIFASTPYRVGFRDPLLRDRFNRGLAAIRASGEYDRIRQRYEQESGALSPPASGLMRAQDNER
jgi:polar amino acid transport system substrate-binding protein